MSLTLKEYVVVQWVELRNKQLLFSALAADEVEFLSNTWIYLVRHYYNKCAIYNMYITDYNMYITDITDYVY